MPIRFASLGSGSKGNSTVFDDGTTRLLIDLGFSLKDALVRLSKLNLLPEQIDGILVTHEHADHVHGVGAFARKFRTPVILTHGSYNEKQMGEVPFLKRFNCGEKFSVGTVNIQSVAVPHDAKEPCQYILDSRGLSFGVLTDLGHVTPHIEVLYRDCHALLLEFNHDKKMLESGPYSSKLKARVGGDYGHLSNNQAASLLRRLNLDRLKNLVVSHVSEKNNDPDLAESSALLELSDWMGNIIVAKQDFGFDWITLET